MPRKRKPPRRIDEGDLPSVYPDCATYHRINTWYAILDIVSYEINERFSQECFKPVADIENVLLLAAKGISVCTELKQLSVFYDDFDYDLLGAQLKIIVKVIIEHR